MTLPGTQGQPPRGRGGRGESAPHTPGDGGAGPGGRIFGLILAGGAGRRMGGEGADKALLILAGQSLAARGAARLGPQVAALALSANGAPERFAALGLPVLADDPPAGDGGEGRAMPGLGPLAGVRAGLRWAAAGGAAALVTVAVDTPFVPLDLVARLAARSAGLARPVVAVSGRAHPTCALWPVAARGALEALLAAGERRLRVALAAQGAPQQAAWPADPDPFDNLNTRADLARAEARLAAGGAP